MWATLGQFDDPADQSGVFTLSTVFLLTVAACWAILIPAKVWTAQQGDSWTRRLIMLGLGGVIGLVSLWLSARWPEVVGVPPEAEVGAGWLLPAVVWTEAGSLTYFAAAFFALRWWRMTDRHRSHRFAIAPVLAAGFWGLVLLLLPPHPWRGVLVLVMASVIVQLVSPWEEPPAPAARKLRLRIA